MRQYLNKKNLTAHPPASILYPNLGSRGRKHLEQFFAQIFPPGSRHVESRGDRQQDAGLLALSRLQQQPLRDEVKHIPDFVVIVEFGAGDVMLGN